MKNYKWINYISILLIISSLSAWYYMLPNFISAKGVIGGKTNVRVEGVKVDIPEENNSEKDESIEDPKTSSFGELLDIELDTPTKDEGVGEMYVRARSAIAIDADTGTILHYQDGKRKMAIASLTKVMTSIIIVEEIDDLKNEIVTISEEAVLTDGTKVGCPRSGYCISNRLQVGEKVSAFNLLDSMLINSANDAAVALAIHIGGSQEEFAKMMNEKAREIGLKDTNFCNPSGLDDENNPGACYSTAYDFARITAYSLQHEEIWYAMKIKEKDFTNTDGTISHHLVNTDILLDQLPNCVGGKTGFTYEAGRSLMMTAHRPGQKTDKVVAVLLDDNYRWDDMKKLFNWVFSVYSWPQ